MCIASFFILGTLLLTLQTTVLQLLPEWLGKPDLLFLLIVFFATHMEIHQGAFLALLFGLLMDIFSGIFLGIHPIIYLILFFVLKGLTKHLIVDDSHHAPLVVISYLFTTSGIFIFSASLDPDTMLDWSWRHVLLQTLILSVISIPFIRMCNRLLVFFKTKKVNRLLIRPKPGNRFR